jgi:hypothetical protein
MYSQIWEPYDVIQRSYDNGKTWGDYCTIRTKEEAQTAGSMVASDPVNYRIVRNQKVIYSKSK